MNIITLENISKTYSEKVLLKDVSLGISDSDKIGFDRYKWCGKINTSKNNRRKRRIL